LGKLDALSDLASSALALAAMNLAKTKNCVILNTASTSTQYHVRNRDSAVQLQVRQIAQLEPCVMLLS
jgi:hypothetical protein